MEQQIAELTKAIQAQNITIQAVETLAKIKLVVMDLKEWKSVVVTAVEELCGEVGELRDQVSQLT